MLWCEPPVRYQMPLPASSTVTAVVKGGTSCFFTSSPASMPATSPLIVFFETVISAVTYLSVFDVILRGRFTIGFGIFRKLRRQSHVSEVRVVRHRHDLCRQLRHAVDVKRELVVAHRNVHHIVISFL